MIVIPFDKRMQFTPLSKPKSKSMRILRHSGIYEYGQNIILAALNRRPLITSQVFFKCKHECFT